MEFVLDSREDKSLAQLCSFLNSSIRRVIYRNGNGWLEQVLSCIGLSSLVEEYENYFNPNTFNRGYTNENDHFNPELGMIKLCNKIKSKKELLNEFLNEIFRRLDEIEDNSLLNQIENCLELLGYALQVENTDMGDSYYLQYLSSGEVERQRDMSVMRKELNLGVPRNS